MTVESGFNVPEPLSFEAAIDLTQSLLDGMVAGGVSSPVTVQTIQALVQTEAGARGFFVTYLSDPRPLADKALPDIEQALQTAPEIVAPLLIKNLAMSTAMAIAHRRNQDEELAQGSDRVRSRTCHLIQALALPQLQTHGRQLLVSLTTNDGPYQSFLTRWGYDTEQRQAIRQTLEPLLLISPSSPLPSGSLQSGS